MKISKFTVSVDFLVFFFAGLAKDESSLRDLKVIKGAKIMVVGSTMNDVLSVNAPNLKEIQEESKAASSKEPLSQQKVNAPWHVISNNVAF